MGINIEEEFELMRYGIIISVMEIPYRVPMGKDNNNEENIINLGVILDENLEFVDLTEKNKKARVR